MTHGETNLAASDLGLSSPSVLLIITLFSPTAFHGFAVFQLTFVSSALSGLVPNLPMAVDVQRSKH